MNVMKIITAKQRPSLWSSKPIHFGGYTWSQDLVWVGMIQQNDMDEPAIYVARELDYIHKQAHRHYESLWINHYCDQFPDEVIEDDWRSALWQMEDLLLDEITYLYWKVPLR